MTDVLTPPPETGLGLKPLLSRAGNLQQVLFEEGKWKTSLDQAVGVLCRDGEIPHYKFRGGGGGVEYVF